MRSSAQPCQRPLKQKIALWRLGWRRSPKLVSASPRPAPRLGDGRGAVGDTAVARASREGCSPRGPCCTLLGIDALVTCLTWPFLFDVLASVGVRIHVKFQPVRLVTTPAFACGSGMQAIYKQSAPVAIRGRQSVAWRVSHPGDLWRGRGDSALAPFAQVAPSPRQSPEPSATIPATVAATVSAMVAARRRQAVWCSRHFCIASNLHAVTTLNVSAAQGHRSHIGRRGLARVCAASARRRSRLLHSFRIVCTER